jgi:2-iminobutanoate/2-iminopropanoate deaminase
MKKIIYTNQAPEPIGPYSQAVQAGNFLFCSGQIAIDPTTGEVVEGGVKEQATQVMKNIQNLVNAAGFTMDQIVKTTIFLRTMDDFTVVNEVYGSYFNNENAPARETVAVVGLPKNVLVEISVTCYQ